MSYRVDCRVGPIALFLVALSFAAVDARAACPSGPLGPCGQCLCNFVDPFCCTVAWDAICEQEACGPAGYCQTTREYTIEGCSTGAVWEWIGFNNPTSSTVSTVAGKCPGDVAADFADSINAAGILGVSALALLPGGTCGFACPSTGATATMSVSLPPPTLANACNGDLCVGPVSNPFACCLAFPGDPPCSFNPLLEQVAFAVPPVPDGTFGTAMRATRSAPDGSAIDLEWDVSTCLAQDYNLLYGSLSNVSSLTLDGAECGLYWTGQATWIGVPPGDLWFLVVAQDGSGSEGSWGTDGSGAQRAGALPSGECGNASRDNSGTCPY